MPGQNTPRRLYKYRAFGVNTLRALTRAEVFYANPSRFNDPLDCNPTIRLDIDGKALEHLCYKFLVDAEGKNEAIQQINNYRHLSTEYDDSETDADIESYYMQMLASEILRRLRSEFATRGVLSLAQRWDCPLMWSHYADKHRGVCLEYETVDHGCYQLCPVDYSMNRSIKASDLLEMENK